MSTPLRSPQSAAAPLGVSYNTFRKLIREGDAPAPIDLGLGRSIFDRTALDAALEARSKPARIA
jgi:excisionase family DNA binding protein